MKLFAIAIMLALASPATTSLRVPSDHFETPADHSFSAAVRATPTQTSTRGKKTPWQTQSPTLKSRRM
jgi:hypothetical protein